METLISVERAMELVVSELNPLDKMIVPLSEVNGYVLADDIIAPLSLPSFVQSGMDGYAFSLNEDPETAYEITGEIAAGSQEQIHLKPGTAVRIFTGAPLPDGADTVLMQEKARVENGKLYISSQELRKGDHVRQPGADIRKGDLALKRGTLLQPAAIGFLASLGIANIPVIRKPRIAIVVTGNELQKSGTALLPGKIYESNSLVLIVAFKKMHIGEVEVIHAQDDLTTLSGILEKVSDQADMVLVVGGVSVGEYDFTLPAFKQNGVNLIFHKIRQKPGKPLLFGTKNGKVFFGLPGNPASVLTCFYKYVLPAIGILMGSRLQLRKGSFPANNSVAANKDLVNFMRAYYEDGKVSFLTNQESFKMGTLANANCIVEVPENVSTVKEGEIVQVMFLPD